MRTTMFLMASLLASCTFRSPAPEDDEFAWDGGEDTGGGGDVADDSTADAGASADDAGTADAGDAGEASDSDAVTVTCTAPDGADRIMLYANVLGGWNVIATATGGTTVTWIGALDARRLDLLACTANAPEGSDCGYTLNSDFNVWPYNGVTRDGDGFRIAGSCVVSGGPFALELVPVDNGRWGGNFHLRRSR